MIGSIPVKRKAPEGRLSLSLMLGYTRKFAEEEEKLLVFYFILDAFLFIEMALTFSATAQAPCSPKL